MQTAPKHVRITRFTALGCLGVILLSGTACSGEPETILPHSTPISHGSERNIKTSTISASIDKSALIGLDPEPIKHSTIPVETQSDEAREHQILLEFMNAQTAKQLDEILSLYRRLHIELDDDRRSILIIDLFGDTRLELRQLGFELVDRDLSSSTVLKAEVGEAAKYLLKDPNPQIRSQAARLITRLVPLDAMIVLTESLKIETDSIAAEPMLLGVARWPNAEAAQTVLEWFVNPEAPFSAVCNAVWSLETTGLWDAQIDHPKLIKRLREVDSTQLSADGMKLIASIGNASDLELLVSLLMSDASNQQQWAASALVETPRAVEMLVQAAEKNSQLFQAAVDSLVRHRATPEGLRRLVSLPYPNDKTRTNAIVRMGEALENDRLGEAIGLADLSVTHSVLLLNRLLQGQVEITQRVSNGIILLGEIELNQLRPNRAYEAMIALDGITLDPAKKTKSISIQTQALILMGKFLEAAEISTDTEIWITALGRTTDQALRNRIATTYLETMGDLLTQEQTAQIQQMGNINTHEGDASEESQDPEDP